MDAALSQEPHLPVVTRVFAAAGLTGIAAGGAAVWYFDPAKESFFPVCALYSMTGFACPGCGLTRGFHALFHGDVMTALDYNALTPLVGLMVGFLAVSLGIVVFKGQSPIKLTASAKYLVGALVVLVVFGVVRNLPFYPFTFLYP